MARMMIGFTGAFGSGTSFLAKHFFEERGYTRCSLSTILKKQFEEKYGKPGTRQDLQEFGNTVREGNASILAEQADKEFIRPDKNIVIESIRNPAEIRYFRDKYPEFILIGVFADYDTRWERVKDNYQESKDYFDRDEQKDKGSFEPSYGQRISDCFFEADLILSNNRDIVIDGEEKNSEYFEMKNRIDAYLSALKDPSNSNPTLQETLMAAAYTSGRRSKCIKRKVGAVIADRYDRIISSGFNGVPRGLKECKALYAGCYRSRKRKEVSKRICEELPIDPSIKGEVPTAIESNIKLLDFCRALHGEESAILNLVGRSADMHGSTIYVTTYPCNLCANKIAQVGIEKVIYFEPYPVEEAKRILEEANVTSQPFEGVTFRAFFRFFKYEP